jgi:hypothetical protein
MAPPAPSHTSTHCRSVGVAQVERRRAAAADRNPSRRGGRRREWGGRWAERVAWRSRSASSHSSKIYGGDRSGRGLPEPEQAAAGASVELGIEWRRTRAVIGRFDRSVDRTDRVRIRTGQDGPARPVGLRPVGQQIPAQLWIKRKKNVYLILGFPENDNNTL